MPSPEVRKYLDLPYWVAMQQQPLSDGRLVWFATHPELPGCDSHGDTPGEALESLREARELYLAGLIEYGQPVPTPAEDWRDAAAPASRQHVDGSVPALVEPLKVAVG